MVSLAHRLAWLGLLVLIVVSALSAVAATNTVDESGLSYTTHPATINQLKPSECTMNLTSLVVDSGTINGGGGSALILGSSGPDSIKAKAGNDCILAGGGNDTLDGDTGNDVLLGGNGNDRLIGDKGTDYCNGGNGNDTTDGSCESTVGIP